MRSDDFMNAEDVARYLHLGKNTVYQLAKSGKLASYRVGRKLKFTLEDVEAYVVSTHQANGSPQFDQAAQSPAEKDGANELAQAASFGELAGNPFVIAGGDVMADLIASELNANGMPAARLVQASYTALVNLYAGDADAAVVHLYDQRSNSYNVPYVRSLAPGVSVVVIRLYGRKQGFIVQRGNPKNLSSWGALLREGVRLSNREIGGGSRVLLDEKLRAMDARSEVVEGYDSHAHVASAAIRRVSKGLADVAIGTRREAQRAGNVSFVPLQDEWVDIVIKKTPESKRLIKQVSDILTNDQFRRRASMLGSCDISNMGSVVYES